MDEPTFKHGAFCWNELMTTDVEGAKAFYTKLFGWATQEMPMEGMTYTVVSAGDTGIGGIMAIPPEAQGMPPMWGAYVTVENVDATAALARELGGTVVIPPQDIPNVGRFCVIQDPQGATIAAITHVAPPG